MAKSELGTKRLCPNCGAKYYDLGRDPVICPKCGASFMTGVVAARPEAEKIPDDGEGEIEDEVEFVPLEEAEEGDGAAGDDVDEDVLGDVGGDLGDNGAFMPDEEEDDDVGEVVRGDVGDGEDEDR